MREIMFRGKRVDNGEWVYGSLAFANWYLDDKPMTIILPTDTTLYPHSEVSGWESVIPETVGQFTGLYDKEGKMIFEGDIVEHPAWSRYSKGRHYFVRWEDGSCGFEPFSDSMENCGHCGGGENPSWVYVVGNIYDNPDIEEDER